MDDLEWQALHQERKMIKEILDFHVKNKDKVAMSSQEFDEYVNVILDRINEIDELLKLD